MIVLSVILLGTYCALSQGKIDIYYLHYYVSGKILRNKAAKLSLKARTIIEKNLAFMETATLLSELQTLWSILENLDMHDKGFWVELCAKGLTKVPFEDSVGP